MTPFEQRQFLGGCHPYTSCWFYELAGLGSTDGFGKASGLAEGGREGGKKALSGYSIPDH